MAIEKSDLHSPIWASCDELRGCMDVFARTEGQKGGEFYTPASIVGCSPRSSSTCTSLFFARRRFVRTSTEWTPPNSTGSPTSSGTSPTMRLMANLMFLPVADHIESGTYLLYDCVCGTDTFFWKIEPARKTRAMPELGAALAA